MTDITTSSTTTSSTTKRSPASGVEALTKAVYAGRDKEVEVLLLEIKNNISAEQYINMLNLTIQKKDFKMLNQLISSLPSSLCELHSKVKTEMIGKAYRENQQAQSRKEIETPPHPLIMAIRRNYTEIIKFLLEKQKDNISTETLSYALYVAAKSDKIEIIEVIMSIMKDNIPQKLMVDLVVLQGKNFLPEIKFLLAPKTTLECIEKTNEISIDELFQIIRHISTDDNKKALWEKDFYTCLENKLKNAVKSGHIGSIEIILDNQDIPVTLPMVAKAFQIAKKENATSGSIEVFERKIQVLTLKDNENEKNIFDFSLEHELDEVFSWALKTQPLEQDKVDKLFNDFKRNDNVVLQQKLLEANVLSKECIVEVLNETADKQSKNAAFFDLIIRARHHKETLKEFIDNKLASESFDTVHRVLLTPAASMSQSAIIDQMSIDHKKKIFFQISNPELIKVFLANVSVAEKFDLLLESYNLKDHEAVLTIYNNASLRGKVSIWSQFKLTKPQHKTFLDHLLSMEMTTDIFQMVENMLLEEDVDLDLVNILLTKLDEKQLKEFADKNKYFKDVVNMFLGSLSRLTPYPYEMVKNLLEISPKRISQKEIVEQMAFNQKIPIFFKDVSEEDLNALLKSHLKFNPQNENLKKKNVTQKTFMLLKGINEEQFNALVDKNTKHIFQEDIIKKMSSTQKMEMLFKDINEKTLNALLQNITLDEKVFIFGNYSTLDRKATILEIYEHLSSEEKSLILSQLETEGKNNLFHMLMRANIEEIIAALVSSEKPQPKLMQAFLQELSPKQIGQLVDSNPCLKDTVIAFLTIKPNNFIDAIFDNNTVKNMTRADIENNLTVEKKLEKLATAVHNSSIDALLKGLTIDQKLTFLTNNFKEENKPNILRVYKRILVNEKASILSTLIEQKKNDLVKFLLTDTEEKINVIVSLEKSMPKLTKVLLEKLSAQHIAQVLQKVPSIKDIVWSFIQSKITSQSYDFVLSVLQSSLTNIDPQQIIQKLSEEDKIELLSKIKTIDEVLIKTLLSDVKLDKKLQVLTNCFDQKKPDLTLVVYKHIRPEEKSNFLSELLSQKRIDIVKFLISKNAEESITLILNLKEQHPALTNALFEVLSALSQNLKILINYFDKEDKTNVLNLYKSMTADNKYKILYEVAKLNYDIIPDLLKHISTEQKLKFLNDYFKENQGWIALNVYKHISFREMAKILLVAAREGNFEKIYFIITSFPVHKSKANAFTGKVEQLLQSSPALKAAMISFFNKQFASQSYNVIENILRSPLKDALQREIMAPMSEESKFDILFSAAKKSNEAVIRFLLEYVKTPEQQYKFLAKNFSEKNKEFIFNVCQYIGVQNKFVILIMTAQQKNVPLQKLLNSIKDEDKTFEKLFLAAYPLNEKAVITRDQTTFLKLYEKLSLKNKQNFLCELVLQCKDDWLTQLLLENIEESTAIILSLYKEKPSLESHQKLLDIFLEVLPTERLTEFLNTNDADMVKHFTTQFGFLKNHKKPLSLGVCNVLQYFAVKNPEFVKTAIIDKMNEENKFDLLLTLAKSTTENNRKDSIRMVLDSLTVEQKHAFVEKYMGAKSLHAELSNLYLCLNSEEMLDIFTSLDKNAGNSFKNKTLVRKQKNDWVHAIDFEKIEQDKQRTITLVKEQQPLLTIGLLKLLSAQEIVALFQSQSNNPTLAKFIQECMLYDDKMFEVFLSALKDKISIITELLVQNPFLCVQLLNTAAVKNNKEVAEYILSKMGKFISQNDKVSIIKNLDKDKKTDRSEIKQLLQSSPSFQYVDFQSALQSNDETMLKFAMQNELMRIGFLNVAALSNNKNVVDYILNRAGGQDSISYSKKEEILNQTPHRDIRKTLIDSINYNKFLAALEAEETGVQTEDSRTIQITKSKVDSFLIEETMRADLLTIARLSNNPKVVAYILGRKNDHSSASNVSVYSEKIIENHLVAKYDEFIALLYSKNQEKIDSLLKNKSTRIELLNIAVIVNNKEAAQHILARTVTHISSVDKQSIIKKTSDAEMIEMLSDSIIYDEFTVTTRSKDQAKVSTFMNDASKNVGLLKTAVMCDHQSTLQYILANTVGKIPSSDKENIINKTSHIEIKNILLDSISYDGFIAAIKSKNQANIDPFMRNESIVELLNTAAIFHHNNIVKYILDKVGNFISDTDKKAIIGKVPYPDVKKLLEESLMETKSVVLSGNLLPEQPNMQISSIQQEFLLGMRAKGEALRKPGNPNYTPGYNQGASTQQQLPLAMQQWGVQQQLSASQPSGSSRQGAAVNQGQARASNNPPPSNPLIVRSSVNPMPGLSLICTGTFPMYTQNNQMSQQGSIPQQQPRAANNNPPPPVELRRPPTAQQAAPLQPQNPQPQQPPQANNNPSNRQQRRR